MFFIEAVQRVLTPSLLLSRLIICCCWLQQSAKAERPAAAVLSMGCGASRDADLLESVKSGDADGVSRALAAGAEINGPKNGSAASRPLVVAASSGHLHICKLLIDANAGVGARRTGEGAGQGRSRRACRLKRRCIGQRLYAATPQRHAEGRLTACCHAAGRRGEEREKPLSHFRPLS